MRRNRPAALLMAVLALGLMTAGAVLAWRHGGGTTVVAAPAPAGDRAARRETRPTLDPARFTGKAARAYQVAREIPDVLDQLTCHCSCTSEYGHASLLSCYVDGHGST